jgi:nucleotide-binding universal stress UspA family protein
MKKVFRIVVGIDGSLQSRRALDWAINEATARRLAGQDAVIDAVTAWQYDTVVAPIGAYLPAVPDARADAAGRIAAALAAAAPHDGIAVTGLAVEGPPDEVLTRASDDADLLVLGSHGHRQLHHAVLGSVAENCIRNAICPVVVIPVSRSSSTSHAHDALATVAG